MKLKRTLLAILYLAVFFGTPNPFAQESSARFSSSQGFSIVPPAGWQAITKDNQHALVELLRSHSDAARSFDANRMAVMLFDPADTMRNLNVIVSPTRVPIDDSDAEQQYASAIRQMGYGIQVLSVGRRSFGNRRALVAEFEAKIPAELSSDGQSGRVHQLQAVFPGTGKTFIITCTASISDFARFEPLFTEALASLEFSASVTDYFNNLPGWARNALIGAAIGLVMALLSRKRPSPPSAGNA